LDELGYELRVFDSVSAQLRRAELPHEPKAEAVAASRDGARRSSANHRQAPQKLIATISAGAAGGFDSCAASSTLLVMDFPLEDWARSSSTGLTSSLELGRDWIAGFTRPVRQRLTWGEGGKDD
jgi:hypothetical protein